MTEAEWMRAAHPWEIVEFVRDPTRDRKLRLLACAACRRVWNPFVPSFVVRTVCVAEGFADGSVAANDLSGVNERAVQVASDAAGDDARSGYGVYTAEAAAYATGASAWHAATCALAASALAACDADFHTLSNYGAGHHTCVSVQANFGGGPPIGQRLLGGIQGHKIPVRDMPPEYAEELAVQAGLIHDIFGNPFRSVTFSPEWRTDTALSLARQMYESREFGAMPILADALQYAGCDHDDLLAHCRGDGPHVRGCWVVDLVLGKE